ASGLNLEHTDNYVAAIDNAIETILLEYPESKIYKRGTVFYSKDAAKASKQDLTYLGSCTVLLVFLLIFAIFRTLNPVVLALLSVTFGLVAGSFLVVFCFNSINLIVIGMCLSIIGVVLDYSTYYLTLRLNFSGKETSFETIKRMQKPLIIAATTDVIAYLIILLFPLEPLKQLALFCIGAISYSCLFVVLVEPYLCQNTKKVALPLPTLLNQYLKLASKKTFSNTLIISLVVISAIGLFKLKANDDPSLLQTLNPTLKQQDDFISKLLNTQNSQKFIIVSATSFEDLLFKNELVKAKLDKLIETKAIKSYKTIPFNSQKTQQQDLELLQSNTKVLQDKLSKMHLNLTFKDYQEQIFDEAKFFDSAYFKLYEQMLLAKNGTCALTIILNEVNNGALIKEALEPIENTLYLDRHEDLTHAFTYLRELISFVVLSFIVVIFVISCIRLKLRLGLLATVFSILALTTALTALAFSGLQLNLFSQLALILVLGIGINYAIFFTNNKEIEKVSLVAIATALLTTLLTIGILIFSSVAAIQGFAIVLSTGIIIAFLLATILKNYAK
ncbi:MAG: MMPL family transporter, partial [Succinivibrio sp.]|nr:MMPL family transporter [Succinivibrio sp.]